MTTISCNLEIDEFGDITLCLPKSIPDSLLGALTEKLSVSAEHRQTTIAFLLAPTEASADDRFEDFWRLYNKRIKKKETKRIWNSLSEKDKRSALAYVPTFVAIHPDVQYRPYPERYLRHKRWLDEEISRIGKSAGI